MIGCLILLLLLWVFAPALFFGLMALGAILATLVAVMWGLSAAWKWLFPPGWNAPL